MAGKAAFKPDIDIRRCKFVWLGTHQKFDDAFTFIFEETENGWVWAHAYQFDDDTATFIVECGEATWQKFGFGEMSKQVGALKGDVRELDGKKLAAIGGGLDKACGTD